MRSVRENLIDIQNNMLEVTDRPINIIAVTKYVSKERTKEAIEAGIGHIGESKVHDFLAKYEQFHQHDVKWHFIGTLQSRKVKEVISKIDYLHSLDRIKLAEEIEKRAEKQVNCFVQVNVAKEETKQGIDEKDLLQFVQSLHGFSKINVIGLMTMAPYTEDEKHIEKVFSTLQQLQKDVQALKQTNAPCVELSMGMSNDYPLAAKYGSTFVRIGSVLVGE
ncbi:MAG: YggS family pyridoxal phosphate-dependent enzyme [Bacilli bacterium]